MLIFIIQVKADLIPIDVDQLKVFPLLFFLFYLYSYLILSILILSTEGVPICNLILSNLILSTEAQPAELSGQLSHSRYFGECQRKGDHA